MLKKSKLLWGGVVVVLILIGLALGGVVVTRYFYSLHRRETAKVAYINKDIVIGDTKVIVKRAVIYNYFPATGPLSVNRCYDLVRTLPPKLESTLNRIFYLYSLRFDTDNRYGTLGVDGIVIYPHSLVTGHQAGYLEIRLGELNSRGAIRWEWCSNTGEFVTEARRVPLNTTKIRVMVTDKRSNVVKTLDIQPEWETLTYRFTDAGPPRPPGNDPSTVILEFINQLRTTEKPSRVRVEDLIHPHRRNDFPWENLTPRYWRSNKISVLEDYITYEGRRLGYRDVFSATISFVKIISYGESIAIARQKIYFTDYNHGWKIIDADPVAVVVEPEILAKLESKEKASGTCSVYRSPQFGYSFRIPGKWEGKYIVREQGNATSFIYIAHPTKNTSLLTFNVYTQPEWTNRLRLRQADHEIKFAVKDGLVIALAFPATNPYKNLKTDKKYAEEYLSMILTLNEVRERFSK